MKVMDISKAKEILGIEDINNTTLIKKNYHNLAKQYHPDKNNEPGAEDKFKEINEAYTLLTQNQNGHHHQFNFFNNIANMFKVNNQNTISLTLSAKEYLSGTTKKIPVKSRCGCERKICLKCAGSGYKIPQMLFNFKPLDVCMDCVGDGFVQNCLRCENGFMETFVNVSIPSKSKTFFYHVSVGKIKLELEKPYYFYENKIYCTYDITLKESLTGFNKIFKDPFGENHNILINKVVKTNDGYKLKGNITLVFNVIYPKKLSTKVIEQISSIDF